MVTNTSDLSDRIRALPELLGVSTAQFCERAGFTTQTFSAYQLGKSKPGADALAGIVSAWSINPFWLLLGEGDWKAHEEIFAGETRRYVKNDFNLVSILERIRGLELDMQQLKDQKRVGRPPRPYQDTEPQGQAHEPEGEE